MKKISIKVFLPCRSGSQRIKNKNIRKFYKYKFGLIELKINQLLKVNQVQKIILSTNDQRILNYLKKINNSKILIDVRPDHLANSNTKTDNLITYAKNLFNENDHILWTHVTSPFFGAKDYDKAISVYKKNLPKFDTLVGSNLIQDFIFNRKHPINYNFKKTFWPNTQKLKKLYKINNTIFLTSKKIYEKRNNRIGRNIFFYNVDKINSIDIDNIDDFILAEKVISSI